MKNWLKKLSSLSANISEIDKVSNKIKTALTRKSLRRWTKKIVKFRPLRTKLYALMLTYLKSTMRVRSLPMQLSSGHVILMPRKF